MASDKDTIRSAVTGGVACISYACLGNCIPELWGILASLKVLADERGNCLRALDEAIVHLDRVQATAYSVMENLKSARARWPL
jgi:hypothetical protein